MCILWSPNVKEEGNGREEGARRRARGKGTHTHTCTHICKHVPMISHKSRGLDILDRCMGREGTGPDVGLGREDWLIGVYRWGKVEGKVYLDLGTLDFVWNGRLIMLHDYARPYTWISIKVVPVLSDLKTLVWVQGLLLFELSLLMLLECHICY